MKKILFIISLLFCVSGFSQSFNLSELIKLCKLNEDFFDTYVTQKGYQFISTSDENFQKGDTYTFKIKGANTFFISKNIASYDGINKTLHFVTFQTPNSKNYLSIKNEVLSNGYVFIGKEMNNSDRVYNYAKGNIAITLTSFVEDGKERLNPRTGYTISVVIEKK